MKKIALITLFIALCAGLALAQEPAYNNLVYLPLVERSALGSATETTQAITILSKPYVVGEQTLHFGQAFCKDYGLSEGGGGSGNCYLYIKNPAYEIMVVSAMVAVPSSTKIEVTSYSPSIPMAINAQRLGLVSWIYTYSMDAELGQPVTFDISVTCYWLPLGVSFEEGD